MKTNAVDLRRNMKDIMRAVGRNEPVTVLYHGKEKAIILPIENGICGIGSTPRIFWHESR